MRFIGSMLSTMVFFCLFACSQQSSQQMPPNPSTDTIQAQSQSTEQSLEVQAPSSGNEQNVSPASPAATGAAKTIAPLR